MLTTVLPVWQVTVKQSPARTTTAGAGNRPEPRTCLVCAAKMKPLRSFRSGFIFRAFKLPGGCEKTSTYWTASVPGPAGHFG
jgi:hypothetical protein